MQTNNTDVLYHTDERGIAYLTLNRPEKHNAFDEHIIAQLTDYLAQAAEDVSIRALVLGAKGKNFCAGADLGWMQKMVNYSEHENVQDALKLAGLLEALYRFPKPTIARVQGAAFGGAVGLIACCDIGIANKLSKFCLSEVKLGLIPATISPYVINAMSERVACRYFMTAEVFSARRARRLGLLSEVVGEEDLDSTIDGILENILKNGPLAVSAAKKLCQDVAAMPMDQNLLRETSRRIAAARVSEEGQEGLNAFLEKRPPNWRHASEGSKK